VNDSKDKATIRDVVRTHHCLLCGKLLIPNLTALYPVLLADSVFLDVIRLCNRCAGPTFRDVRSFTPVKEILVHE
jgi:hypothetical protein